MFIIKYIPFIIIMFIDHNDDFDTYKGETYERIVLVMQFLKQLISVILQMMKKIYVILVKIIHIMVLSLHQL